MQNHLGFYLLLRLAEKGSINNDPMMKAKEIKPKPISQRY